MTEPALGEEEEDPASVGERAPIPWLREEDLDLGEEDLRRNEEQAKRNAVMREALRLRRCQRDSDVLESAGQKQDAPTPEDIMYVPSPMVSRARALGEHGQQPPWFVPRPHIENPVLRLHEELIDFMDFMRHTDEETKARRAWVKEIAAACRSMWPACKVRVFGSFLTGLSLPNADVDVAVFDVPCKQGTAMRLLADRMLALGKLTWLEIIDTAKVPLLKIRSQACGLRADVVFNNRDGIDSSHFVRERLTEFQHMKPLVLFLKYFLLQRGLHETFTGGMGSFLLCNVVLHFLQQRVSRRDSRLNHNVTLGHLLYDFLKYYAQDFRYDVQVISVLRGGAVSESPISAKGKGRGKKGGGVQLRLESPSDPSVDLGGPCFRMSILRNLFHHALACLNHLFVSAAPAGASMLCPLLLDPAHPVITSRHTLLAEQPMALQGLKRGAAEEPAAEEQAAPKRARVDEGVPLPGLPEEQEQSPQGYAEACSRSPSYDILADEAEEADPSGPVQGGQKMPFAAMPSSTAEDGEDEPVAVEDVYMMALDQIECQGEADGARDDEAQDAEAQDAEAEAAEAQDADAQAADIICCDGYELAIEEAPAAEPQQAGGEGKPEAAPSPLAAKPATEPKVWQRGNVVRLKGMLKSAHLNGARATLEDWDDETGRWEVEVASTNERLLVMAKNLAPCAPEGERPSLVPVKADIGEVECQPLASVQEPAASVGVPAASAEGDDGSGEPPLVSF